jgi:protein ImuB
VKLWLCLRFHQLPLQCLERNETRPAVVLERQRVLRANDCAAALGIRPGMGSATVRALAEPEPLHMLERDRAAEQRCLQQLCSWAYSISPELYSWREDSLLLEVGSCLTLYRGLPPLLAEVDNGLACRGYSVRSGLAATPRAAWLLSHAGADAALAWEQDLQERLGPLPLTLLAQEFPSAVDSLRRAGLHTLGDILALPFAALGRRCGERFCSLLRQLLGQQADLQPTFQPPACFSDDYWFGYEVRANGELLPAMQLLLQSLCRFLRNTQLHTTAIRWQLVAVDGRLRDLIVRSDSSRTHWESWYQLTRIQLDQLALQTGVEGLALHCDHLRPGETEEPDLFRSAGQREPLGSLLDRLRSRLGLQAVTRVACRDEHLPELAVHEGVESRAGSATGAHCAQRPFWLMPQPQALAHSGAQLSWRGPLTLVYGPERIEDNWWQQAVSRDYFIARGEAGQHYWIFRDRRSQRWFIHGIFV